MGNYYHGTNADITNFSTEFAGVGHCRHGPGIYFSNSEKFSKNFGSKLYEASIIEARLRNASSKKKPCRAFIHTMAKRSPTWEDSATNWDEDPKIGLRRAVDSILTDSDNYGECIQSLWAEFFMQEEEIFCKGMASKGIDGMKINVDGKGLEFVTIFNEMAIRSFRKV